jgi:hypothetical protein
MPPSNDPKPRCDQGACPALQQYLTDANQRVITLREYVDTRLQAIQGAVDMTREAWMGGHDRVVDDIRMLREDRARLEGKASLSSVYVSYALSILAIVASIVVAIATSIHTRIP